MMRHFLNHLITLMVTTASALTDGHQYHLGPEDIPGVKAPHDFPRLKCPLSDALPLMVDRHQPLVSIPSVCYDDLGSFAEDERWEPFKEIPDVLKDNYPNV